MTAALCLQTILRSHPNADEDSVLQLLYNVAEGRAGEIGTAVRA